MVDQETVCVKSLILNFIVVGRRSCQFMLLTLSCGFWTAHLSYYMFWCVVSVYELWHEPADESKIQTTDLTLFELQIKEWRRISDHRSCEHYFLSGDHNCDHHLHLYLATKAMTKAVSWAAVYLPGMVNRTQPNWISIEVNRSHSAIVLNRTRKKKKKKNNGQSNSIKRSFPNSWFCKPG